MQEELAAFPSLMPERNDLIEMVSSHVICAFLTCVYCTESPKIK